MRYSLLSLALALSLPVAANASYTYDVVTGFSSTSDPNGVWSYGFGTPSNFTAFSGTSTFLSSYGLTVWADGNNLPAVGSSVGLDYGTVHVPSDELFLHPGQDAGEDAIVLFTIPTSGFYTANGTFSHEDTANSGTGQIVSVGVDGIVQESQLLTTAYGDSFAFSGAGYLSAGDTLFFDVSINDANYTYDSTGLQLSIVGPSPEPSSLVLLGTGILGLAGAARRKFRT